MSEYINKSALVVEIERIKREECPIDTYEGRCKLFWFEQFLSFLNTLEVKEVDLEKELKTLDDTLFDLDGVAIQGATSYLTVNDVKDIAKHFYELGLSVSNKAEKEVQEEPYVMSDTGSYTTTTKAQKGE